MSNTLTQRAFWDYSCQLYAHSDVALASLALQDEYQVNINMIMLLCWCLREGLIVDLSQFRSLAASIEQSEQGLAEHREKRRKHHPDNQPDKRLYETLKAEELELEKAQQSLLVDTFQTLGPLTRLGSNGGAMNASLAAFIHLYELREHIQARDYLRIIVKHC